MERVDLAECIGTWDWRNLQADLDRDGFALTPRLLDDNDCAKLKEQFDQDALFRKSVVMEKHAYGRGQYRYWAYPLPGVVNQLRQCFYPYLAGIANHWQTLLQLDASYPGDLEAYLAECHRAGQTQPTPLLLRYREGDYNRLHRDLYGEWCFPLQVVVLLDQPDQDFVGGELVLVEQAARMQSKANVVPMRKGHAVIFAVNQAPRQGSRGYRRVKISHGVSRVHRGERHTLGIIFHDAL